MTAKESHLAASGAKTEALARAFQESKVSPTKRCNRCAQPTPVTAMIGINGIYHCIPCFKVASSKIVGAAVNPMKSALRRAQEQP